MLKGYVILGQNRRDQRSVTVQVTRADNDYELLGFFSFFLYSFDMRECERIIWLKPPANEATASKLVNRSYKSIGLIDDLGVHTLWWPWSILLQFRLSILELLEFDVSKQLASLENEWNTYQDLVYPSFACF